MPLSRRLSDLAVLVLLVALPVAALLGALGWSPAAAQDRPPLVRSYTLGFSAQGRPIEALQIGDGPRKLVVVGNTHGAPEANTYQLTLALIEYLQANPNLVPPDVRLFLIPSVNPDGIAIGWRFDSAGVDLNRNMNTALDACPENDWRVTVQGARGIVSDTGGAYADSQPESRLVRGFLIDAAGVIFLHSNAGLVFPASCEHAPSIAMAETYARAAGYVYARYWDPYTITGGMHDWAGGLGIAAITPELVTGDQIEFEQNRDGLLAVLAQAETLMPLPAPGMVADQVVPPAIYRYWRALGGMERFGAPLGPAIASPEGVSQVFRNARIALRYDRLDTPLAVQPDPIGLRAVADQAYGGGEALAPIAGAPVGRYFAETGHSLKEAFLDFWQRNGAAEVFGLPLSEEFSAITADGEQRIVQYFERAVLAYYPEDGGVRLEPLGVREATLEALQQADVQFSVR